MSIRLMAAAWDADVSGGDLLVLLALADFAGDDGWCWPAVATIAQRARMTDRGARGIIRRLEEKGLILCEISKGGKGRGSRYMVLPNPEPHSANTEQNPEPHSANEAANPEPHSGNDVPPKPPNPEGECIKPGTAVPPNHRTIIKEREANASPKKARRLEDHWSLPEEWRRWALDEGIMADRVDREAAKFRNYWTSKGGAAAAKTNWYRTWQNWCFKVLDDLPKQGTRNDDRADRIINMARRLDGRAATDGRVDSGEDHGAALPLLSARSAGGCG